MSPIFVYKCIRCEHKFEKIRAVKMREKFAECPKCQFPSKFIPNQDFSFDMRANKGKKMRRKLNAKQGIG